MTKEEMIKRIGTWATEVELQNFQNYLLKQGYNVDAVFNAEEQRFKWLLNESISYGKKPTRQDKIKELTALIVPEERLAEYVECILKKEEETKDTFIELPRTREAILEEIKQRNAECRSEIAILKLLGGESRYTVEDYDTGNAIEDFNDMTEAEAYCAKAEAEDRANGTYTPGFYAIRDNETEELTRYNY